jgi:hypothetical protein
MAYAPGSGDWQTYKVPEGHKVVAVVAGDIAALSVTGKEIPSLVAFSGRRHKWVEFELKIPAKDTTSPVVDGNVVFYQIGDSIYAFSAVTATWGVVSVPGGSQISSEQDMLMWQAGDKVHLFDAQTGKWATAELGAK